MVGTAIEVIITVLLVGFVIGLLYRHRRGLNRWLNEPYSGRLEKKIMRLQNERIDLLREIEDIDLKLVRVKSERNGVVYEKEKP